MPPTNAPRDAAFGYLSTWEWPEHGCLGGYLIVSPLGRPLEFHCTAPVRTSRAQQILFGPTLWPYVLGEQIGGTLLDEAKLRPQLIIIDHAAALSLRSRVPVPMVHFIGMAGDETADQDSIRDKSATILTAASHRFELPTGYDADRESAGDLLMMLSQHVELAEPFERIREAIREAHRLGADNQDAHEPAA